MYNICDICCLLIPRYLNQKYVRFVFLVLNIEGNCIKPFEQFLTYVVDSYFEYFLLVEEISRRSNFQNAPLVDDRYAITNSFYIGQ